MMDTAVVSVSHSAQGDTATRYPVEFSASTSEYFRIWIVNVMLSVLTLGIYSAWATVRTRRYFYAHTRLAGEPFEYLAEPIQILKGRLIAMALLGSYLLLNQFAPLWSLLVLALITLLMPWLIYSGLRFRARYSAWCGLRFQFIGSLGQAYSRYLGLPLLALLSLGLAYPWIKGLQQQYIATGHRFCGKGFEFSRDTGNYYAVYLAGMAVLMSGFIVGVILIVVDQKRLLIPGMLVIYAAYLVGFVLIVVQLTNLLWNNLRIDAHRFQSDLEIDALSWLYLSNALAIVASLGLLIPWAVVRTARYRASRMTFLAAGSLDEFVAEAGSEQSAIGAEIGDAFDFDFEAGM